MNILIITTENPELGQQVTFSKGNTGEILPNFDLNHTDMYSILAFLIMPLSI